MRQVLVPHGSYIHSDQNFSLGE
uniref:Uncharacterized protein n=1 Tax=Arundo donax TaxID=35708 RepID=A0A0A8Y5B6_ARUDO